MLTRFSFEEVFGFQRGDVTDSGEHVTGVSCSSFNAVSVVYLPFPRFRVHLKLFDCGFKYTAYKNVR